MLQEARDLQERAVSDLVKILDKPIREITFRAPTGSGKTHMMADFMNRFLSNNKDYIFLVSTLSKGGLAQQNYDSFKSDSDNGIFPEISPYLINTEVSSEEGLTIPTDYNVYVLPRDLYKEGGKLMQGAMTDFLRTMTEDFFGQTPNKKIILIKDECHQATNNLDNISKQFFTRVLNFSATPNLRRGQTPDVQITDDDAVRAKLIKNVEFGDDDDTVEDALRKLRDIKEDYNNLLGVNPCLIIQISNKDKADEEWNNRIKPALEKLENQGLKWMIIANPVKKSGKTIDMSDTNDAVKKSLPKDKWKDYAKQSAIDVIIFKMIISEGWDIPRACMLYQVRDTSSKQLDEQVMGRVRRNPRLLDFETLSEEAQELAMKAWIWGIKPESARASYDVQLAEDAGNIREAVKIKTIKLADLTERKEFSVEAYLNQQKSVLSPSSIFDLYQKYRSCPTDIQMMCFDFTSDDYTKWLCFMEHIDGIKKNYNDYICDYSKSMEVDKETSFPLKSSYLDTEQQESYDDWVWCKSKGGDFFAFDSMAERLWAKILYKLCLKYADTLDKGNAERYLWGKNFPANSEIRYQYYANGVHSSYPDFVMKDKLGIIHLFEVKSLDKASNQNVDPETYEAKVRALKDCYKACSKILTNHYFYLPIKDGDDWTIWRYVNGEESQLNLDLFKQSFKK